MKDFIFVSDFDGTLTDTDFFQILIDGYLKEFGEKHRKRWDDGVIDVYEFLNIIFTSINLTEEEIFENIKKINFDDSVIELIDYIKENNGEFIVLSAGTSYYIEKLFAYKGIKDIQIISNRAVYKDGGIHMEADLKSPFYSSVSGIDKAKVVEELKKNYKRLYYAGDGPPDYNAAIKADLVFAKSYLKKMLKLENKDYVSFESFRDIYNYIRQHQKII
jgi:2,3-diketo-5-methylthio-1-phosphopentane phosphatase